MNTEETGGYQIRQGVCVVCGEGLEPGRGGRINHRGSTVTLCGSICLRTFAKEPDAYLTRLANAMRVRKSRRLPVRPGDRVFGANDGAHRTRQVLSAQVTTH